MHELIAHITAEDKKIESLYAHLGATASLCKAYGDKIGIGSISELAGFAHDIGKASQSFQDYIRLCNGMLGEGNTPPTVEKSDHSTMGSQFVHRSLHHNVAKFIALSIMSHHSGLLDCVPMDGRKGTYQDRICKDISYDDVYSRMDVNMLTKLNQLISDNKVIDEYNQISAKLCAIGGDKRGIRFQQGLFEKYLFSCLCDADRVCTAAFMGARPFAHKAPAIPWSSLMAELEAHINTFSTEGKINKVRGQISQSCLAHAPVSKGRLMQLSVPTGGGKTLSALRFALAHADYNKMDRILYVVPYTSIIEQNAHVARQVFEKCRSLGDVVLECHSNLSNETENEKTKLLSENWDAPIVFTTMVQFLESIFDSRIRRTRRMHALANSILIFDEIQCLPYNCMYMFNEFIRYITSIGNSTVVLCTATQPLLDRVPHDKKGIDRSLHIHAGNKIVQDDSLLFSRLKRVRVHDSRKEGGWEYEEICRFAVGLDVNNLLIIVNTKASAQKLYGVLSANDNVDCCYLSTNMCPEHRDATLQYIQLLLQNPESHTKKLVCVSTQLIEAGVDIDFECVIRFISGLDSIAQAAGRCNRNGIMRMGNVYIINPKNESLQRLPDIKLGVDITTRLLDDYNADPHSMDNDLLSPKAISLYFDRLYYKLNNYNNRYFEYDVSKIDNTLFEMLSQNMDITGSYRRNNPDADFNIVLTQSFKTAGEHFRVIDAATQGVIVPYGDGDDIICQLVQEQDPSRISDLLKKAQRYSINIHQTQFERLSGNGIYEVQQGLSIYYLSKNYYDLHVGLCAGNQNTLIM